MKLLDCLYLDVARQYHFAGNPQKDVRFRHLLKTMLRPRFVPVLLFRLAHWCATHHLRPAGKIFSLANFVLFGLEIGMDSEIGPGLYFPHTSGTVLGAKRIGKNAVIYHNVTLGAKVPDLHNDGNLRPEIMDDVFIGAGAKVLGPVVLEDGVVVGANSVVLCSIPAGCLAAGIPAKVIRKDG